MSREETEQVLGALHGVRVGRTGYLRTECPVCPQREGTRDRRQSLSLHAPTGWWSCYRCRARGRAQDADLVGLLGGVGAFSGGAPLGTHAPSGGPCGPFGGPLGAEPPPEALSQPQGWLPLGAGAGATALSAHPHRAYLAARKVPPEAVAGAGVGCVLRGYWAGRVLVPVLSPGGAWQGWSGRALHGDTLPRYRYPDGMNRGGLVWNAGALHVIADAPCMVVEGVFDGLPHWPHAVAVLGKPSAAQIPILATCARRLAIVLDGDAWRDSEALAWRLQLEGVDARALRLPPRIDPGDIDNATLSAQARALWD